MSNEKEEVNLVSKVLIHESDESVISSLKGFCQMNNLVGLLDHSSNILDILKSNIDLGAVLVPEKGSWSTAGDGIQQAKAIREIRPELPIFLRRDGRDDMDDLDLEDKKIFAGAYRTGDLSRLKSLMEDHLFSRFYPMSLVSGIREISMDSLSHVLKGTHVEAEVPYLVKDQVIFGELFSLIPLESSWCRGYMMVQTTEAELVSLVKAEKTYLQQTETDYTLVNSLLNEITNMTWGTIRSRFFSNDEGVQGTKTQVPIMVNHEKKYISFGSTEPQLCFKFTVSDPAMEVSPVTIYQKIVFNLSWSPEDYDESQRAMDEFVDSGELEMF